MAKKNEIAIQKSSYLMENTEIFDSIAEEMEGMTPTFNRIKIPAGGGIAYEVPSDEDDGPDLVKEFSAVILVQHPINTFYRDKYDGSNNPPDCGSVDGKWGIDIETGEKIDCSKCTYSQFKSAEDGKGKACKQKRRLYLLREGDLFPTIMTLPTGSLGEFNRYIMQLLNKGKKSNCVMTRFKLQKAQNKGGIAYSQAIFSIKRDLTAEELVYIRTRSEQVKAMARRADVIEERE